MVVVVEADLDGRVKTEVGRRTTTSRRMLMQIVIFVDIVEISELCPPPRRSFLLLILGVAIIE